MTDLLKEAIADAKAVREVALANAKLALEEAFTPRLQSMLASKLSEEAEEEDGETVTAEGEGEGEGEETTDESYFFEGDDEEEAPMEEAEEETEETTDESYFFEGDDEEEAPMEEAEEEEETPMEEGEEEEESMDEDLMEIIRQLEEDIDSSEIGTGDNRKPSKVASDNSTEMKKEKLVQMVESEEEEAPVEEGDGSEEEVDIQEILRALREEEEGGEESMEEGEDEEAPAEEPAPKTEAKLREAYAVIQFLRSKLNEINLLNSKLLFSNKLFRSHSLTESQKITVIENFDRATSLREVKLVYATLAESLRGTKNKTIKPIRESYASKPVASTRPSKAILTEGDRMAARLRKLAGIK